MSFASRSALLLLLLAVACTEPEGSGDDDSADDDDSAEIADDDDVWDDDDATELPPVDDVSALVDGYWLLDLGAAEYAEPPNMGILLAASIGDLALLFGVTPASNLDDGVVHILGALGDEDTDPVAQDLCRPTQPFTAGEDGIVGTGDDSPGMFENPAVTLRSFDYDLISNGAIVPLMGVRLRFGFSPDGTRLERGRLTAIMDTRPIALDILGNKDPYAGCELILEASGRDCFECGGENPGNFCVLLDIKNMTGTRQGSGLVDRPCEDIIREDLDGIACDGKARRFERKDEEGYPLCPAYDGPLK
jgi:hypothetical protein